jgi:hypothetical protein
MKIFGKEPNKKTKTWFGGVFGLLRPSFFWIVD